MRAAVYLLSSVHIRMDPKYGSICKESSEITTRSAAAMCHEK